MLPRIVATVLCLSVLGCASAVNRERLAAVERDCAAGDKSACDFLPAQRAINQDEAVKNGLAGAVIVVLLPLAILGQVAEDRQAAGICGWGKRTYAC
jgi:hypothetical protein